jgi:hypothetical protein
VQDTIGKRVPSKNEEPETFHSAWYRSSVVCGIALTSFPFWFGGAWTISYVVVTIGFVFFGALIVVLPPRTITVSRDTVTAENMFGSTTIRARDIASVGITEEVRHGHSSFYVDVKRTNGKLFRVPELVEGPDWIFEKLQAMVEEARAPAH